MDHRQTIKKFLTGVAETTTLAKTIEIQKEIDRLFPKAEKKVIE
jgi:hypothetical protein